MDIKERAKKVPARLKVLASKYPLVMIAAIVLGFIVGVIGGRFI